MFINNDLPKGVDPDTNISLYADDKYGDKLLAMLILSNYRRILILIIYDWSIKRLMTFHPKKCKLLSIKNKYYLLALMFFVSTNYSLGISFTDIKMQLGVYISESFSFNDHCEKLITKTKQQFGILLMRTCHFVNDIGVI